MPKITSKMGAATNGATVGKHGVRSFSLGTNMASLADWRDEIDEMRDVLMGRRQPPVDKGVLTLMEVADAYCARAREIEQVIMRGEADGAVIRGSKTYKFRTGELRSFIELSKSASDLGSRRITYWRIEGGDD
jgi:hypothetical protein